jgi:hypothetical protein
MVAVAADLLRQAETLPEGGNKTIALRAHKSAMSTMLRLLGTMEKPESESLHEPNETHPL